MWKTVRRAQIKSKMTGKFKLEDYAIVCHYMRVTHELLTSLCVTATEQVKIFF